MRLEAQVHALIIINCVVGGGACDVGSRRIRLSSSIPTAGTD
jgi:hypothetical protein